MKKYIYILTAAAMTMASCSNDEVIEGGVAGNGNVSFTITVPQAMASRSVNQGEKAVDLKVAIFNGDDQSADYKKHLLTLDKPGVFENGKASIDLDLIKGKKYIIGFWAQSPDAPYSFTDGVVSMNYGGEANNDDREANNDDRDAFFAKTSIEVGKTYTSNLTLYRPMAQVNFGASDYEHALALGLDTDNTSSITYTAELMPEFDMCAGEAQGTLVTASFTTALFPDFDANNAAATLTVAGTDYAWVSMNYVLPADGEGSVISEMVLDLNGVQDPVKFQNAPIKRNYRTNITGKLFTTTAGFTLTVDADFAKPSTDLKVPVGVDTPEKLIETLQAGVPAYIAAETTIDLSESGNYLPLPDGAQIILNGTLTTSKPNQVIVPTGSTVNVSGTGTFHTVVGADGTGRGTFQVNGGTLNLSGVTIKSDNPNKGSGIYVSQGGTLNVDNANFDCGFYAVFADCDETKRGTVNISNSTLKSISSSVVYGSWGYCANFKHTDATLDNVTVEGVQGAVAAADFATVTINSGNYSVHNTPGYTDAFWTLYAATGGKIIVNGGKFKGVRSVTINGNAEPNNAAYRDRDNDLPTPGSWGTIEIKGGEFSSKGYDKETSDFIVPADGYAWVSNTTAGYPYKVIPGKMPAQNAAGNYEITEAAEFSLAVAELIPKGGSLEIKNDIDMTGIEVTPPTKKYSKNIVIDGSDGNGGCYTISGITVDGNKDCNALFGKNNGSTTISNLIIKDSHFVGMQSGDENATAEDACGALLGFCDLGSVTFENVVAENVTVEGAKYVGVLIGYGSGTTNFDGCKIINCTVKSAFTEDGGKKYKGHAGGIIGYMTRGLIENCSVEGTTFDVLGTRGGVFIGTAQNSVCIGTGNWVKDNTALGDFDLTKYVGLDYRDDKTTDVEVR